jgi:dipeptidyl aminopeptidase/acylaminoacyl peptidase
MNNREGFFRIVSRDRADSKWVVSYEVPDGPVSTWVYDRKSGDIRFVFDDRPDLKKYKLAIMKPVIITARDSLKLVAYLTLPAGVKPEKLSMVLYVHGGPTARDDWGYEPIVQLLANRGYAVLQVNFRGSVGFGNAFQRAGDGQVGIGAMQHDLTDAVKWAVGQGIADPKRVGIFGGSYGGYATLAGLAFTPELYACGAEECGPSNLKARFQSILSFYGPLKELFARIFGDVERDEDYNRKVSPLFHVGKIRAPLLIGQGTNDPRCNIRESDQIVKAMRDRNLPMTYIVYTDEGHGFKRPKNSMDFNGRLEEFLAKHLGGRFEPLEKMEGSTAELR